MSIKVEYTICQIQSGQISLAAKTHRQLNGDPRLEVTVSPHVVTWNLINLVHGNPETLVGMPRQDHVDFYFLYPEFKQILPQFPRPTARTNPGLPLPAVSSSGTERYGGKRVRIVAPVHRYPLMEAELFVIHPPTFHAIGTEAYIHLDVESTPINLYGSELFEVHFGIQANFDIIGSYNGNQSSALLTMEPSTYATIHRDMRFL